MFRVFGFGDSQGAVSLGLWETCWVLCVADGSLDSDLGFLFFIEIVHCPFLSVANTYRTCLTVNYRRLTESRSEGGGVERREE